MQTTPPSAKTIAPPSIPNSPVFASLIIDAVRPAAEEPLPDVYTAIGAVLSTNFKNCDFAVLGSPINRTLISLFNNNNNIIIIYYNNIIIII